jgi:hypothetical protein
MAEIDRIVHLLQEQRVVGMQGRLSFTLAGVSFPVSSKELLVVCYRNGSRIGWCRMQ